MASCSLTKAIILRKRYIIETINDMLKNTAQIVHSHHRFVSNFIINPNRSLENDKKLFLMTAIRKTALYMLDS